MTSGPITSWQIEGKTVQTGTDFIFLGSKITADRGCSHKIKRQLLLGRKAMTNVDNVLKNKVITLPTKVHLVKGMVFPVIMYRCESWAIKKAERQRTNILELWCWRRLFRVPWTTRLNKSILKKNQLWIFIGRTDAEVKALVLWPSDGKSQLIGKDPDAGKDWVQEEGGGGRRWDG